MAIVANNQIDNKVNGKANGKNLIYFMLTADACQHESKRCDIAERYEHIVSAV